MKAPAVLLIVMTLGAHASADPELVDRGGFIGKDIQTLEIDDCAPVTDSPERVRQIGAEHFERGEVLYVQGDYPGAVKELAASYCLIPFYTILKDIGQAYERELEYGKAIAYLERYVMAVPRDAQRASQCAPDPQEDKKNVLARIAVLSALKAKIIVDTVPPNATIVLENENGVVNRARSGQQMEVAGGVYQMTIQLERYKERKREIRAEIGKPYTVFERLDPLMGHIHVRVTPPDARLYINKQAVGTSDYEGDLAVQSYELVAEAPEHLTVTKQIEVLPERDNGVIAIELPPQPQVGRRQLLGYATVAGGAAGALLAGAQDNPGFTAAGLGAGLAAGFFGTYYGTSRDISLGTSSLTITGSLIGGTSAIGLALIATNNGNVASPLIGGGLLLGAGLGYYTGDRWHVTPGDAAIINTGALWGTTAGALFYSSFTRAGPHIGGGLLLSGLGMGTIGGVLLNRYFTVSRGHAALIDVGGVVGLFVGIAAENIFTQTAAGTAGQTERTANFSLGGVAAGLLLAGILTRNMDEPTFTVTPTMGKVTTADGASTATFGISGGF